MSIKGALWNWLFIHRTHRANFFEVKGFPKFVFKSQILQGQFYVSKDALQNWLFSLTIYMANFVYHKRLCKISDFKGDGSLQNKSHFFFVKLYKRDFLGSFASVSEISTSKQNLYHIFYTFFWLKLFIVFACASGSELSFNIWLHM